MCSSRRELRIARRLDQLVAARTWPHKARILRRHPELLGADAQRLLEAERGEVRQLHVVLLLRARKVGPDRAVEEMRAAIEDLPQLVADGLNALRQYRINGASDELALVNLGSVLLTAVAGGGPDSELRRALEVLTEADALPAGTGTEQTALLAALGDAQLQSHLRWRRPAALDTAVAAITAAVSLAGTDSARERSNLGVALSERHLMKGYIGDLQQSVELLADAVEATPEHSPDLPARQANLGTVLVERYHRLGDPHDLDDAIHRLHLAATASRSGTPDAIAWTYNLALALGDRYQRDGDLTDLDQAAAHLEAVVEATSSASTARPARLDQLAVTLRLRGLRREDPEELQRAVALHREAVRDGAVIAGERAMLLGNLAGTLRAWAAATGDANLLHNRAGSVRRLYELGGEPAAFQRAIADYRDSCRRAAGVVAEVGLRCGLSWGQWASHRQAWTEATDAFHFAAEAAEQLVRRQLTRHDKQTWLRAIRTMPAAAAFALSQTGALPLALVRLEWGRARLLADALGRDRADLDVLTHTQPQLAERYRLAAGQVVVAEAAASG